MVTFPEVRDDVESASSGDECVPFTGELVRTVETITKHDLDALFSGRIRSLCKNAYSPESACEQFADKVEKHGRIDGYVVAQDIKRFGLSFYDTAKDPIQIDTYFDQAIPTMRDLRTLCHPLESPMGRLRNELDEVWDKEASIAILKGRKMMAGIARVFNNGIGALAHVDTLGFDACSFPDAPPLITQLSANLYLRVPPEGGELALWHRRILSPEEEKQCMLSTSKYGLDESLIGPPAIVIRPQVGQLIFFDSTRCHAIRPSRGGSRVTMSMFIGLGRDGKLRFWN